MKHLLAALAVIALSLPASASAKGLVALTVCGSNGCHTTRDKQELADAMDAIPQADPGRISAFYKVRETIGEPGQPDVIGRVDSLWMPSIGVIRGEEGPTAGFTLPTPATKRVLLRLARGLDAFPVSRLPAGTGVAGNARVDEVVPAPTAHAAGGGGGGTAWAWWLLALLPAAAAAFAQRRRRRWI